MPPSNLSEDEIYIVDDDPAVRSTLEIAFSRNGYRALCFADGTALLATARSQTPASIILDVHIPGKSGLDILKELNAQDYPAPIFIISGQGDIAMAVDAIKSGAHDFIEKPFRGSEVVARIRDAIEKSKNSPTHDAAGSALTFHFPGREPLTRRECDVLRLLIGGASSKEVGRMLGISPRTIEDHRARIMDKFNAKNVADLIRIVVSENRR